MKEEIFINKNITKWERLEELNSRLTNKNISALSRDEIREFSELFRRASHNLAFSRTHYKNGKTTRYLNQLVSISHNYFYTKEQSSFTDVVQYFVQIFPGKFRTYFGYILVAAGLFFLGGLASAFLIEYDSRFLYYFLPEDTLSAIDLSSSARAVDYPVMSAIIMTNNIRVSFLAFVWGFFAGIGTVYVMFVNGMSLGALTDYVISGGQNVVNYWALILPHGFLELTACFISGGAGLLIGRSVLVPNNMTRSHALIKGAKEGCSMIPGVIAMLVMAGLIEGFFTPSEIPSALKIIFAFVTLLATACYFTFAGRAKS